MASPNKQRNRDLLDNIFAHDYAEKAKIGRMAMAMGYGLDPNVTMPFPPLPSQTINMTNTEGQKSSSLGKLLGGAVVAAALMTGGGFGAAYLLEQLSKPKVFDVELPYHFKDGEMKFGEPRITPLIQLKGT